MKDINMIDNIKVSDKLDDYILMGLEDGIKEKNNKKVDENINNKKRKNPYKVAVLVAAICGVTITSAYAIEKIIDYFKYNKDSIYKYEENKLEKYAQVINKSKKHDGVEFRLDTVAADDTYITVNYTVLSNKDISEISNGHYKNPRSANPFVRLLREEQEVFDGGAMETEATFVSDNELKGIMRFRVGRYNIENGTTLTLDTWDVFGIEKDWSIDFKLNKNSTNKDSYKYNINKSKTIVSKGEYEGETLEIKNKLTVENVVIAPLGNQITITEEVDTPNVNYISSIGNNFALFDEDNNYLEMVDNGFSSHDKPNQSITSSYEFLTTNKNIKSMTLVPIGSNDKQNYLLGLKDINKLPITFEVNEYSKIIVDKFEITEDKIMYSYKSEGIIPYKGDLILCDENGEMIFLDESFSKISVDRDNKRFDIIIDLESNGDKEKAKKIKKVNLYSDSSLKLLYEDQIKFDLKK